MSPNYRHWHGVSVGNLFFLTIIKMILIACRSIAKHIPEIEEIFFNGCFNLTLRSLSKFHPNVYRRQIVNVPQSIVYLLFPSSQSLVVRRCPKVNKTSMHIIRGILDRFNMQNPNYPFRQQILEFCFGLLDLTCLFTWFGYSSFLSIMGYLGLHSIE